MKESLASIFERKFIQSGKYDIGSDGIIRRKSDGKIVNVKMEVNTKKGGKRTLEYVLYKNKYLLVDHIVYRFYRDMNLPPRVKLLHLDEDYTNCSIENIKYVSASEYYSRRREHLDRLIKNRNSISNIKKLLE